MQRRAFRSGIAGRPSPVAGYQRGVPRTRVQWVSLRASLRRLPGLLFFFYIFFFFFAPLVSPQRLARAWSVDRLHSGDGG